MKERFCVRKIKNQIFKFLVGKPNPKLAWATIAISAALAAFCRLFIIGFWASVCEGFFYLCAIFLGAKQYLLDAEPARADQINSLSSQLHSRFDEVKNLLAGKADEYEFAMREFEAIRTTMEEHEKIAPIKAIDLLVNGKVQEAVLELKTFTADSSIPRSVIDSAQKLLFLVARAKAPLIALDALTKISDFDHSAIYKHQAGIIEEKFRSIPMSIKYFEEALTILPIDKSDLDEEVLASILNSKALAHMRRGEEDEAEALAISALSIAENKSNQRLIGSVCSTLGNLFRRKGEGDKNFYIEARQYKMRALEMARLVGDRELEAAIIGDIGIIAFEERNLSEASAAFWNSLSLAIIENALPTIADQFGNLGVLYKNPPILNIPLAEQFFIQSASIDEALPRSRTLAQTYMNLATLSNLKLDKRRAKYYALKATSHFERVGDMNGVEWGRHFVREFCENAR